MENEIYIKVTSLQKKFDKIDAVNGLSFQVYKGDIFGFLGHNGAGKSTTIKILLSLVKADNGDVEIFELPVKKNKYSILQRVGALVDEPAFYNYLSAYKNLELLASISGKPIKKERILEILELVGLHIRAHSRVKTFSHGMKQRLGIAQALLNNPDLLILDEPTNGLDPEANIEIRNLILKLNRELGKTILISSHQLNEIETVANRMVIINKGKAVVEGKVSKLLDSDTLTARFEVDNIENAVTKTKENYPELKINSDKNIFEISGITKEVIGNINILLTKNNIRVFSIDAKKTLEEYYLSLVAQEGGTHV